MNNAQHAPERQLSDSELQALVASNDSGGRNPNNQMVAFLIAAIAFVWSMFQLWIAQPQLWFGEYLPVLNAAQTRPVHLGFAMLLAFLAYPALKSSPRDRIPVMDWILAIIGSGTAFYVFFLLQRPGGNRQSGSTATRSDRCGSHRHRIAARSVTPRARTSAHCRGRRVPALRIHGDRLADPGPDCAQRHLIERHHQCAMVRYRWRVRNPLRRIHHVCFFYSCSLARFWTKLAPGTISFSSRSLAWAACGVVLQKQLWLAQA